MAYFVVHLHCQGQLWLFAWITLLIFNSDSESLARSAISVQSSGRSLSSSCRKNNDETLSEKNLPKTTAVVLRSSRSTSQSILIAFLSRLVFVSTVSLISTPFAAADAIFFGYFFDSSIYEDSIGFPTLNRWVLVLISRILRADRESVTSYACSVFDRFDLWL